MLRPNQSNFNRRYESGDNRMACLVALKLVDPQYSFAHLSDTLDFVERKRRLKMKLVTASTLCAITSLVFCNASFADGYVEKREKRLVISSARLMACPGRPQCSAPGLPSCSVCCTMNQIAVCAPRSPGYSAMCKCE